MSAHAVEPHKLLALYHSMVMARTIERRLWVAAHVSHDAVVAGPETAGSEGVQVAAAACLRPGADWVVPGEGDLALCLAMGVTPLDVMLAFFARATDPSSGGRQAPGRLSSRRARIVSTSAVPAAAMPHAAGIAYASRLHGRDEVTLLSIKRSATAAGDWHEGLNFASVHRLPLICVVQDARPRVATPSALEEDRLVASADGYGAIGERVDGGDFESCLDVMARAADRARAGEGPTVVHALIRSLGSRAPGGTLLAPEELEAVARHDPVERMRASLEESRLLDGPGDLQVQRDCIGVVEAAFEEARSAPLPEPAQSLDNVWSPDA